jgi:hypothetical protein
LQTSANEVSKSNSYCEQVKKSDSYQIKKSYSHCKQVKKSDSDCFEKSNSDCFEKSNSNTELQVYRVGQVESISAFIAH